MAATYLDLINEASLQLHGYSDNKEKSTALTSTITSSASTFVVDDIEMVNKGVIEIDREMIYTRSKDAATATVTIEPWGRGYYGSTAAAHTAGARVVSNPDWPSARIASTINEQIAALYPALYAIGTDETLTVNSSTNTYVVPAAAESLLAVLWNPPGPGEEWVRVTRWTFNYSASTTDFASGKSVEIWQGMTPGRPIRLVFRKQPSALVADGDVFATTSGLPESCRDVVVLGTVARMLVGAEPGRVITSRVENASRDQLVPVGSATSVARQITALVDRRVAEERRKLALQYPVVQQFVR